ncbi:hypothetical protein SAMN02745702_02879 [Desulfobaculum bizertense DSM 18034]|uniref:Uncharacterized protein n=1 Tax=Desulfobaculum bizertense DSM 18034 TaxID=1121442 RepID=A0A1T4X1D0_9BACT|nr:hypothetical protein SAMN02745702_02879 [Desulfobaculum bizertense DSM 18034]
MLVLRKSSTNYIATHKAAYSARGAVLLGRCPKPCKGRCPLTPPKDEALGNPAFARNKRGPKCDESYALLSISVPFFSA